MALDLTTGTIAFFDGGSTMEFFDAKTRKFGDHTITLSMLGALDIFYDNQGTLWAIFFKDNTNDFLFGYIDEDGGVSPGFQMGGAENGYLDDSGVFDYKTNTYYFSDGNEPTSHLFAMNMGNGKNKITPFPFFTHPAINSATNALLGMFYQNNSLASVDLATSKLTTVLGNPPYLDDTGTGVFDLASNSYIVHTLDDRSEKFFWWGIDISTGKTRVSPKVVLPLLGAALCPSKL